MFGLDILSIVVGFLLCIGLVIVYVVLRRILESFFEDWKSAVLMAFSDISGFQGTDQLRMPIGKRLATKYWFCRIPLVIWAIKNQAKKRPAHSIFKNKPSIVRTDSETGRKTIV